MIIEEDEHKGHDEDKGHPVLILKRTEKERFPFAFGLAKAKSILSSISEIEDFVKKHETKQEKDSNGEQ